MGKLKFMILKEKHVAIITDALRAYIALRAEEYQKKPDLKKAQMLDEINDTLDMFICPRKPKSKIQKKIEKISK
jgi:hypothetical protein